MLDDIVVKLIPERQGCKLWTRERGDGAQVQAVTGSIQSVAGNDYGNYLDRRYRIHTYSQC